LIIRLIEPRRGPERATLIEKTKRLRAGRKKRTRKKRNATRQPVQRVGHARSMMGGGSDWRHDAGVARLIERGGGPFPT